MALVVFLRGVNVGGYRRFQPSLLAKELSDYDVVNIGAAGTFVVRKPGSRAKFRAQLLRHLPFETEVLICDGRDVMRAYEQNPFENGAPAEGTVRFVSILAKAARLKPALPIHFPAEGEWLVRVIDVRRQFVFGEYRRHMRTIGYLGKIDNVFGVPITTRNWNTITAIVRVLKGAAEKA